MTFSLIDPQFPQIPKILEPGFMREVLQNALFRNRRAGDREIIIERCEVGEKRYKPGKSFMLSYKLSLQDLQSNNTYEQCLTAQLCPVGSSPSQFEIDWENPVVLPAGIPSVSYLSELDILLWSFPYDRKLTQLQELLETEHFPAYFTAYLTELNLRTLEAIDVVQAQVVHYLPEQSCMVRYIVSVVEQYHSEKKRQREIIIYGKNYHDHNGAETYAVMHQLAVQSTHCAKPLYYDPTLKTLWQAHVSGKPFTWDLLTMPGNHSLIANVAKCIADFHACDIKTSKQYGITEINQGLNDAFDRAMSANSTLGSQVRDSVRVLYKKLKVINLNEAYFNSPLHQDLKMGNLLVAVEMVYLIDMDCVCKGDPLIDVGSFIANLYLNGLREGSDISVIDGIVANFVHEYSATASHAIDYAKLNWYIAAALIHEVLRRSLRQQCSDRLKHLDAYITISNRYSALCKENGADV